MTHWTPEQTARLAELMAAGTYVGFWCSDAHGYPSNGGGRDVRAVAMTSHATKGPLSANCGGAQLHATQDPARWLGCRVWVVALHGETRGIGDKSWSLSREIIGEILPEEAILARVALRLGVRNLRSADLRFADLRSANLHSADLRFADLHSANLRFADLRSADLHSANLRFADLRFANLRFADLRSADLRFANLRFADLPASVVAYCNRYTVWPTGFDTKAAGVMEDSQ